jgi:hypothetical protein
LVRLAGVGVFAHDRKEFVGYEASRHRARPGLCSVPVAWGVTAVTLMLSMVVTGDPRSSALRRWTARQRGKLNVVAAMATARAPAGPGAQIVRLPNLNMERCRR